MAKRQTRADVILAEARQRVEKAWREVDGAREALRIAEAAANALQDSYEALAKSLAPKPRKKVNAE